MNNVGIISHSWLVFAGAVCAFGANPLVLSRTQLLAQEFARQNPRSVWQFHQPNQFELSGEREVGDPTPAK